MVRTDITYVGINQITVHFDHGLHSNQGKFVENFITLD